MLYALVHCGFWSVIVLYEVSPRQYFKVAYFEDILSDAEP